MCVCVYLSFLLPSWLFESWIVAVSESVKLLFISLQSMLLVEAGRYEDRRENDGHREKDTTNVRERQTM